MNSLSNMAFQPTIQAAESLGLDAEAILSKLKISTASLRNPAGRVSIEREEAFWDLVIAASEQPLVALELARATAFGTFPVLDFMGNSCNTIGEVLDLFTRYCTLIHGIWHPNPVLNGLCLEYQFEEEEDVHANQGRSTEYCVGVILGRCRHLASAPLPVREVHFRHPPVAPIDAYEEHLGVPVRFGAPVTVIVFDASVTTVPCKNPDPTLLASVARIANAMLDAAQSNTAGDPQFVYRARSVVTELMSEDQVASAADVARRLGVSTRSLQRRLGASGTSFRRIVEESRQSIWRRLSHMRLDDQELAFRLGYASASAFRRARKRWTSADQMEP